MARTTRHVYDIRVPGEDTRSIWADHVSFTGGWAQFNIDSGWGSVLVLAIANRPGVEIELVTDSEGNPI